MTNLLDGELVSLSEAARRLKKDRKLVGIIVRTHRIETHNHPRNGKAKALNRTGMERLRELLKEYERQAVA